MRSSKSEEGNKLEKKQIKIMDTLFRDASQSKIATRMRLEDMLPIAEKLGQVGYHSVEMWGGATFDSCIRYLGEDPWERIREIKKDAKYKDADGHPGSKPRGISPLS